MNTVLDRPNYTDAIIKDYTEEKYDQMVVWSDLYNLKYSQVPESIRQFMREKADYYKDKPWAYSGKDYSSPFSTQIEVNSKSDEVNMLHLLATVDFKDKLNKILANAAEQQIFVPGRYNPITEVSNYKFNGENQDIPQHKAGTFDLVRTDKNYRAAYSIEVKTSTSTARPKELHKAEIVLLHVLNTDEVVVFISPEPWESRQEINYINIGSIKETTGWKNVRIDNQWNITAW